MTDHRVLRPLQLAGAIVAWTLFLLYLAAVVLLLVLYWAVTGVRV